MAQGVQPCSTQEDHQMKSIVRRAAIVFGLAAVVATGALAFAQGAPPQPRHQMGQQAGRGGAGPMGMMQQLNLTDDQRTRIQSLMQQQRQAHQGEMQKMGDLEQQLKNAIFADSGPADTTALQQQVQTLRLQLEADRITLEKQIAAVLTPDQRKQVRDMPGNFIGGPGMGRGMRGRGF
jgi:Spy/CpxP family protein refolding chaperone